MAHKHPIYDTDKHFVIDPITKKITTEALKLTLAQHSHNSERFTFEIPKEVEGHDMSLCNLVEIHYQNIDAATKSNKSIDIYKVTDLQSGTGDNADVVFGSWLIDGNATQYVGGLIFAVRFACIADDGTVDYNYPTMSYSGITVGETVWNSETIVKEYPEIIEQFEARIASLEAFKDHNHDYNDLENIPCGFLGTHTVTIDDASMELKDGQESWVKVSDSVPPKEALSSGVSMVITRYIASGTASPEQTVTCDDFSYYVYDDTDTSGCYGIQYGDTFVRIYPEDTGDFTKGTYLANNPSHFAVVHVCHSLTVNGYEFIKIKKLPDELLPDNAPKVDTAAVGQIIKVKAVDENGKPTEWEAADLPEGGTSDYLKLTNRPTETIGGDTLTWDGNTEGLVSDQSGLFYKVSSDTPDVIEKMCSITIGDGSGSETFDAMFYEVVEGAFGDSNGVVFVVKEDGVGKDVDGVTFPETGIYMLRENAVWIYSLTIPGYTGFTKEVIKQEVLPEALQFGELPTGSDTLTWDGNTAGLIGVANQFYKVSDVIPAKEVFANGGYVYTNVGGEASFPASDVVDIFDGIYGMDALNFLVVTDEAVNVECDGVAFPESGIYFYHNITNFNASLTIPGYTGFPSVKKVQEKYLPNGVMYVDSDGYLYPTADVSDTTERMTKTELQAKILSGTSIFVALPIDMATLFISPFMVEIYEDVGIVWVKYAESTVETHTAEYTPPTT